MRAMVTTTIVAIVALASAQARAEPVIDSVLTSPDQTTLSISGTGFGVKETAAPAVYDDFEAGAQGQHLAKWLLTSSHGRPPRFSSERLREGSSLSARCLFDEGQYLSAFGVSPGPALRRLYLDAWYLYEPADPPPRNHKLFRVYAELDSGSPNLALTCFCNPAGGVIAQDGVDGGNQTLWNGFSWASAREDWVHLQAYFEESGPDIDSGQAKLWIDGELILDEQAFRTRSRRHPDSWHSVWFGNYAGHDGVEECASSPGDTYTYWDNVYVDYTQARVEVGNSPYYESCTQREIQIPTVWLATSVTVTLNLGSFDKETDLFMFVVDDQGVPGRGYPLVFDRAPEVQSPERRLIRDPIEGESEQGWVPTAVPNPFAQFTRLELSPRSTFLERVMIFDLNGRRVRSLRPRTGGEFHVLWDGSDDSGRALSGGVYLARLQTRLGTSIAKVVLSR